jgi:hypothetical protein
MCVDYPGIDWDSFRDSFGLLAGKPHPSESESNAVLFSACERVLRLRLRTWGPVDQFRLAQALELAGIVQGGKLMRPVPWRQDEERPDDHIGIGACGAPGAARAVLDYFDGHPVYLSAFKYRFPAIIAHLEWAAGERPSLWRRIYWMLSFLVSGGAGDQDPWVQGFLMLETAPESWQKRLAAGIYWARLKRAWPGGLAQVFSGYWSPEHPTAQACTQLGL